MSTPKMTPNLKERGFKITIVICPKCKEKWEEVEGKNRVHCNIESMWWPEYQKVIKCAEIDLMPPFALLFHLKAIMLTARGEDRSTIANFLDQRISLLEVGLNGIKTSPSL